MGIGFWIMFAGFICIMLAPIIAFMGSSHEIMYATGVSFVGGLLIFLIGWGLDWVLDDNG